VFVCVVCLCFCVCVCLCVCLIGARYVDSVNRTCVGV
jgi:hypothetical protein